MATIFQQEPCAGDCGKTDYYILFKTEDGRSACSTRCKAVADARKPYPAFRPEHMMTVEVPIHA